MRRSSFVVAFALVACDGKPSPPPAASPDAAPVPLCAPTPGQTASAAEVLDAGALLAIPFCARHRYFALELAQGDILNMTATFTHDAGDIDVELIGPEGVPLAGSTTTTDSERISNARADLAGRHLVHLYGKYGTTIRSQFDLTSALWSDASCADDALEPNDLSGTATLVSDGGATFAALFLCPRNKDHFRLDLATGEAFSAALAIDAGVASDAGLSITVYRLDPVLPNKTYVLASGAVASYGPAALPESLYLAVTSTNDAGVPYALSVQRAVAGAGRLVRLSGTVTYERQLVTEAGYVNKGYEPAAFVRVEAVGAATGLALSQTTTNDAGAFIFPDLKTFGDAGIQLRALAWRVQTDTSLTVLDNAADQRIVAAISPVTDESTAGPDITINLAISEASNAAGAFHLVRTASLAAAFTQGAYGKTLPALDFYWTRGTSAGCYTCYLGGAIAVGSASNDPDEYDDSVVLHEIGHHVVASFGRDDSVGGNHDGNRTDAVLAFSEGFASYFSLAVRADPLYLDYKVADVSALNFETMSNPSSYNTSNGTLSGDVSEWLVTAVLWDMTDSATDPGDAIAASHATALEPVATYFLSSAFSNRGQGGRDFVDYLDGWVCRGLGLSSEVQALLANRQFPYDFPALSYCPE